MLLRCNLLYDRWYFSRSVKHALRYSFLTPSVPIFFFYVCSISAAVTILSFKMSVQVIQRSSIHYWTLHIFTTHFIASKIVFTPLECKKKFPKTIAANVYLWEMFFSLTWQWIKYSKQNFAINTETTNRTRLSFHYTWFVTKSIIRFSVNFCYSTFQLDEVVQRYAPFQHTAKHNSQRKSIFLPAKWMSFGFI